MPTVEMIEEIVWVNSGFSIISDYVWVKILVLRLNKPGAEVVNFGYITI